MPTSRDPSDPRPPIPTRVTRRGPFDAHAHDPANAHGLPLPAAIQKLFDGHASLDPTWTPSRTESDRAEALRVSHRLSLGATPLLKITWTAQPQWYAKGFRVEVHINAHGFAPLSDLTPIEQLNHGQCVVSADGDDGHLLALAEGPTFVTLLLISPKATGVIDRFVARQRQKWTDSPVSVPAIVRFSVAVPSLKLAKERIAHQNQLAQSVRTNVNERVELAAAAGDLDLDWYARRHEADVRRQTTERLATWRAIEETFAVEGKRVAAMRSLDAGQRRAILGRLDVLRVAELRRHQLPVADLDVDDDGAE